MAVTLTDLIARVNRELENIPISGFAEHTSDGTTESYRIIPQGYSLDSTSTLIVTLNDVETAAYAVDYDNGIVTFEGAPSENTVIRMNYYYVYWTDAHVTIAINSGISALFPHFYTGTPETKATNGSTYEFALTTNGVAFVKQVEYSSTSAAPWAVLKRRRYEKFWSGESLTLRFYAAPSSGSIRVHCICRPQHLTLSTSTLDDSGVPDRAADAIVSYACYFLLSQKMAPRQRIDVAQVTTGKGILYPDQMNTIANAFYMKFQFQLASTKMAPWSGV
jgi:hypothetical protein